MGEKYKISYTTIKYFLIDEPPIFPDHRREPFTLADIRYLKSRVLCNGCNQLRSIPSLHEYCDLCKPN